MSASLVGSEMCIRDSPAAWLCRRAPEGRSCGTTRLSVWWRTTRCSCSVSYTHLTLPTICSV
eukprot:2288902-Alexandrium_andersonii.AAC.1